MPKVVDHEERRRHIADAVFRVIARQGFDATGLRGVAAEAGVSMGTVQHYFGSKDEMLLFALDHMRARVLARVERKLSVSAPGHREFVATGMRALLPLDPPSREEAAVNIAFFAASQGNREFRRVLRQGYARLLVSVREQLRQAAEEQRLARGIDPDAEASALFFLGQGLIGPLLIGAITRRDALALLDDRLDHIFR